MSKQSENVLGKVLEEKARIHKDRPFLFFENQTVTLEQLDLVSNQYARGFMNMGIQKGDKIAILMENHPDFLYTWFGAAKAGALEVPINIFYKGNSLNHVLSNSDSKLLVIDSTLMERLQTVPFNQTRLGGIICRGKMDKAVSGAIPLPVTPIDELCKGSSDPVEVHVRPSDPASIMYTSGTTGLSKGVVTPHQCGIHNARLMAKLRQATPQDRFYTFFPLFHANAQTLTILTALVADAQVVLSQRFSATDFWDEIRKYGATQFNYLGAVMPILAMQEPKANDADNPVRIAIGAACPPAIMTQMEKRFGITCLEGFGMSETGMVMHWTMEDRKIGSCGKALHDLFEVMLVDDDDQEVGRGQVGEIVVRPKRPYIMMSEYYGMPEKTLESFRNLWFHTGDYARQDEEGYFYFVDRKKDALRRRGENISSFEVEAVINSHPKVMESAVFAVPSELSEDEIMAAVVLAPKETLAPEDLIRYCNERMAYFAVPRYLEYVPALPKTPTNRVEKYRLREKGVTENTWDREKAGIKLTR
jgi:crotonobetaine/carnitine-CoA ligase